MFRGFYSCPEQIHNFYIILCFQRFFTKKTQSWNKSRDLVSPGSCAYLVYDLMQISDDTIAFWDT